MKSAKSSKSLQTALLICILALCLFLFAFYRTQTIQLAQLLALFDANMTHKSSNDNTGLCANVCACLVCLVIEFIDESTINETIEALPKQQEWFVNAPWLTVEYSKYMRLGKDNICKC
jgi:hypothetical protein